MSRERTARALASAATLAVASAIAGGEVARWIFALVAALFPVLLIAFAAGSRVSRPALTALALLFGGSTIGILVLARTGGAAAPLAGLPPATWLMLSGLGLAPLVLVAVVSARADRCR